MLCREKASKNWLNRELEDLNRATAGGQFYDIRRAVYLTPPTIKDDIGLIEGDRILQSDAELDGFLHEMQSSGQRAIG